MVFLEALLKCIKVLQKIIKGRYLSTGPQNYEITRSLLLVYSLWVSEHKTREYETETNNNNDLAIKYLVSRFFPPKALQNKKIYLFRSLYKPRKRNIRELISGSTRL